MTTPKPDPTPPTQSDAPAAGHDPLLERLAALPAHDLASETAAEHMQARARRAFEREARLAERPALRRATHLYGRVLEPSVVALAAVVYLVWAFARVLELVG